mmetsp:Transcript_50147/g.144203  ORF Transcript_50147/g.144203 Transcript_50147/m.144203 type:complete len:330 (-) Transcript_50147:13-1002(-)
MVGHARRRRSQHRSLLGGLGGQTAQSMAPAVGGASMMGMRLLDGLPQRQARLQQLPRDAHTLERELPGVPEVPRCHIQHLGVKLRELREQLLNASGDVALLSDVALVGPICQAQIDNLSEPLYMLLAEDVSISEGNAQNFHTQGLGAAQEHVQQSPECGNSTCMWNSSNCCAMGSTCPDIRRATSPTICSRGCHQGLQSGAVEEGGSEALRRGGRLRARAAALRRRGVQLPQPSGTELFASQYRPSGARGHLAGAAFELRLQLGLADRASESGAHLGGPLPQGLCATFHQGTPLLGHAANSLIQPRRHQGPSGRQVRRRDINPGQVVQS